MTTNTQIEKAKEILNINNFLPKGIDIGTRLKLVDFRASNYEYWGNKYVEASEHYDNSVVALQFEHSMVEKPFWIILFKGAQQKVNDAYFVSGFWNLPYLENALYQSDGILQTSTEDGVETILNIAERFNNLWFEKDEASEDDPIIWNDSDMLSCLANKLENILNVKISLNIPLKQIKKHHIIEIEKALSDAKLAFLNNLSAGGAK